MTEKEVVTPEWLYCPYSSPRQSSSRGPWYLKVFGCLIKNFRHDERGGFPPEFQAWQEGNLRLFFFPSLFQRERQEGVEAIAVRRFRLITEGKIMVLLRWVDTICNPQKFALFNDLS